MTRIGVGRSHAKVILMGDHAVVYGYPAIALPVKDLQVTCTLYRSQTPLERDPLDPLNTAIFAALDFLDCSAEDLTYAIDSDITQMRGLGSSAAVAVAAVRSVFDYYDVSLRSEILEMLAGQAEKIAHTKPSGLDVKTCISNTPIKYVKDAGFSPIAMNLGAYLLIGDTGIRGNTSHAVARVAARLAHVEEASHILAEIGGLTERVELAISHKDLECIGESMTASHRLLGRLGVSCLEADRLVEEALQLGALGAKMTGGGLGGCIIALVDTYERAETIRQTLFNKGVSNSWITSL